MQESRCRWKRFKLLQYSTVLLPATAEGDPHFVSGARREEPQKCGDDETWKGMGELMQADSHRHVRYLLESIFLIVG